MTRRSDILSIVVDGTLRGFHTSRDWLRRAKLACAIRGYTVTALASAALLASTPAHAGRGSSPGAIQGAIRSGSIDAIASELERAEHLVCPSCVSMVRPLLDHGDVRVRQVAAWWLSRRGLKGQLVKEMSGRLAGTDAPRARNAADVLGALRSPEGITPLASVLDKGAFDADTRAAAARGLGAIGELEAQPALVRALASREAPVRAAALQSLRELRGFADPSPALAALTDMDAGVRGEAVYTIGATGARALSGLEGATLAQRLAVLLTGDASAAVRRKAAWALGEIGAPVAVAGTAMSRAAQRDPDPRVRSLASAGLGKLSR